VSFLCRLWKCLFGHRSGTEGYHEPGLPDSCGGCAVPAIPFVAVKFRDDFAIEYRDGDPERLPFWKRLQAEFEGIEFVRLYRGLENEKFRRLIELAQKSAAARDQRYDPPRFFQWFRVDAPARTRFGALAEQLRAQPEVETAYVEQPGRPPAPIGVPTTNPKFAAEQRYLQAPMQGTVINGGINAVHAWTQAPASTTGAGVKVVDYERGWGFTPPTAPAVAPIPMNHPDLPAVIPIPFGIGNDASSAEHGTNVLGVFGMRDDTTFGVGAAPAAAVHVVTPVVSYTPAGAAVFDHASALQAAIDRLRPLPLPVPVPFGDVLLIEHTIDDPSVPPPDPGAPPGPPRKQVPLELSPANFNLIELATQLGIAVVEAAGNGRPAWTADPRLDLDAWSEPGSPVKPFLPAPPNWRDVPAVPPFKDSGAILASCANVLPAGLLPRAPTWAPIGGRIDCWGWASSVRTASTNLGGWSIGFGGTSAAAAMVAGAAIILQGHELAVRGSQLSPRELRRRLADRTPGVHTPAALPSAPSTPSGLLGVMPNLASLIR
jgi:serine protease